MFLPRPFLSDPRPNLPTNSFSHIFSSRSPNLPQIFFFSYIFSSPSPNLPPDSFFPHIFSSPSPNLPQILFFFTYLPLRTLICPHNSFFAHIFSSSSPNWTPNSSSFSHIFLSPLLGPNFSFFSHIFFKDSRPSPLPGEIQLSHLDLAGFLKKKTNSGHFKVYIPCCLSMPTI